MPLTASAHRFPSTRCSPAGKSFALYEAKQVRGPLQHFCTTKRRSIPDLCRAVPRISTSFGSICFAPTCSAKGSFRWFSHHRGCYAFDCLCACSGLRHYTFCRSLCHAERMQKRKLHSSFISKIVKI